MEKKVLYIASTAEHLRRFHRPCLKELAERGWRVTAAGAGEGFALPEGVRFLPVPLQKSFSPLRNREALGVLMRELRSGEYDLVLLHTTLAAFYARLALLLTGKGKTRVVNTVHGYLFDEATPLPKRLLLLAAEKLCAAVTDDILVMNECDWRIARRHRLCRGAVIRIPGMGVDFTPFTPAGEGERRAAREAFALPEDAAVLLCAAEFSPRKNQGFLIRSLASLPENVYLLLPGDGEKREECLALAKKLGVERRVRAPGALPSVAQAIRAADICVSASRSEGLPFAVMEAMHAGLPAVLSRVKGHEDLLRDNSAGFLYPFGDETAFCQSVRALLDDECLRARMGRAAMKAVAPYALEGVTEQVLSAQLGLAFPGKLQ